MTEEIIIPAVEESHSTFSPSGSGRWIYCPGSIPLEAKLEIQPGSSVHAREGTAAHELAALCLRQGEPARKFLGVKIMEFTVNPEMANAVQVYLDYVSQFRSFESRIMIEQKLDLSFIEPHMKGTADYACENPEEVDIVDYKHGKGVPVEAHDDNEDGEGGPNSQLGLYAIAVLREIFQRRGTLDHIKRVGLHIVQPRCPHPDGPVREFITSVEELRELATKVKEAIADAKSDKPSFRAGIKQCKWCPAAGVCKTLAEYNMETAQLEFSALRKPATSLPPHPNMFDDKQIRTLLKRFPIFEAWMKAVGTYALDRHRTKRKIPGMKLVRGRANRIFHDRDGAALIAMEFGFTGDDLFTSKFKTPAQLEQLVGGKFKSNLEPFITKPLGKIVLADESDPRPAADPADDAARDFAEFKPEGDKNG